MVNGKWRIVNGRRRFVRCQWLVVSWSLAFGLWLWALESLRIKSKDPKPKSKVPTDNGQLTTDNSNPKPFAQTKFQPVHLAIIRFVVVAAKVQHSVENQLRHLLVEIELIVCRLTFRLLD